MYFSIKGGKHVYMRLVHVRYQPDSLAKVQQIYDQSIIPRLQKTEGCLFASALKSEVHPGEGISMTLWKSRDHAEAYEKSGEETLEFASGADSRLGKIALRVWSWALPVWFFLVYVYLFIAVAINETPLRLLFRP